MKDVYYYYDDEITHIEIPTVVMRQANELQQWEQSSGDEWVAEYSYYLSDDAKLVVTSMDMRIAIERENGLLFDVLINTNESFDGVTFSNMIFTCMNLSEDDILHLPKEDALDAIDESHHEQFLNEYEEFKNE